MRGYNSSGHERRGWRGVAVWKEGLVRNARVGSGGNRGSRRINCAILGFVNNAAEHYPCRSKTPTQHHQTTKVVFGTQEELGIWLPNIRIWIGNGLGEDNVRAIIIDDVHVDIEGEAEDDVAGTPGDASSHACARFELSNRLKKIEELV